MSKRCLPIYGEDGKFIQYPQLVVRCLMAFPNDAPSARQAANVLGSESNFIKLGHLDSLSQIGLDVLRRISKGTPLAILCGYVAFQVLVNLEIRRKPDFGKAVFMVSEWASITKDRSGKSLPSDASRLRKTFNKLKSAIHCWVAFASLEDQEQNDIFTSSAVFHKVMQLAYDFQRRIDDHQAISNWNTWRVPDQYTARMHRKRWVFQIPTETEWAENKLSEYTANIVR